MDGMDTSLVKSMYRQTLTFRLEAEYTQWISTSSVSYTLHTKSLVAFEIVN